MNRRGELDALEARLLSRLQSNFPIAEDPFSVLGAEFGLAEDEVIRRVRQWKESGLIRSISAVFEPSRLGLKSALVAARVDPSQLEEVAAKVNHFSEVTHNYARKDTFNLWFTLMAASDNRLQEIIETIKGFPGVRQLALLPALRKFKLQLNFAPGETGE